jgi:hypothetical protein
LLKGSKEEEEGKTEEGKHMETAPALIILGILLAIGGFILVAYVTIYHIYDPSSVFDIVGFALFGAGIISIWGAWHKLS